jgi:hypothetical protein
MKKWYQSRTIWINLVLTILGGVATVLQQAPVSPDWVAGIVAVAGALNIFLRADTTTGITR